jgi:glutathione S-transferase
MITLYQFRPAFGLPNASPFCMKVETYLRMAALPYRLDNRGRIVRAPKGKLPFIEDDGRIIADSGAIIEYLKQRYGDALDAHLAASARATGHAVRRMIEENLYWAAVQVRWFRLQGWAQTREAFFGGLPPLVRSAVATLAHRGMRKELWGHGMGRHSDGEIMRAGCEDIAALADILADKPFLLGEVPSSFDATAYAFIANIVWVPIESELKDCAAAHPQLEAYCRRMQERYFARNA